MAELKLGNKYECFNCGVKFYDLSKGSATCPKCGADQKDAEEESPLVTQSVKRRRKEELLPDDAEAKEAEKVEKVEEVEEDIDIDEDDLDEELLIEAEAIEEEEEDDGDDEEEEDEA